MTTAWQMDLLDKGKWQMTNGLASIETEGSELPTKKK